MLIYVLIIKRYTFNSNLLYVCIKLLIPGYKSTHTHTQTRTHARTHTHTHTHAHAYTHTHIYYTLVEKNNTVTSRNTRSSSLIINIQDIASTLMKTSLSH